MAFSKPYLIVVLKHIELLYGLVPRPPTSTLNAGEMRDNYARL